MNDFNNNNNLYTKQLIANLNESIQENNLNKFKINLNEQIILKPNLINQLLFKLAAQNEICEFVECLMNKINISKSHFVCTDNLCKLIVNKYILQKYRFTQYSVCFLLRCYDVNLIKQVLDSDLLIRTDCESWYLMFVASYQERFFSHSFDDILESFLARYILICKLRCNLDEKRAFLTWFSGSLHLYCDDYFIQTDEIRFKTILSKLFESLILNGLLTLDEFNNLYQNIIKRNEELLLISSLNFNNSINFSSEAKRASFPSLDYMFPLSLKNLTRLAIKRSLKEYTQKSIHALPVPNSIKKFLYFDSECDFAFKGFLAIKNV